ncbi:8-amino-7-oxononanoate synthase, partial [Testudinibacter aquarius]
MLNFYAEQLAQLQQQGRYRTLPDIRHEGKWIWHDERKMLNFSSNDYLGLAANQRLKQQFLAQTDWQQASFTSSSSRLLTGNFPIYAELESVMASQFQREACLLFNSGYHANIGILPALADKQTLILADKLVHASLIDGIRLSAADYQRYRHNDYTHLQQLLEKNSKSYQRIIIVTESVFSMDGDMADLRQLVALKQRYRNVMLYVDEAHALGVFGQNGLGLAENCACIGQIDFLVGTFGKALAAMGAYVVCDQVIKDYLINKMRPLIFSTALSP